MSYHSPSHPGFLEGRVQRKSSASCGFVVCVSALHQRTLGLQLYQAIKYSRILTKTNGSKLCKTDVTACLQSPRAIIFCLIETFHVVCSGGPVVVNPGVLVVQRQRTCVASEGLVVLLHLRCRQRYDTDCVLDFDMIPSSLLTPPTPV